MKHVWRGVFQFAQLSTLVSHVGIEPILPCRKLTKVWREDCAKENLLPSLMFCSMEESQKVLAKRLTSMRAHLIQDLLLADQ